MTLTNEQYWKIGTDQLELMNDTVHDLIKTFPENIAGSNGTLYNRRTLVQAMMNGQIGEQFMVAPASTRRAYHNAFPCGLVDHSLRVVRNALRLAETLASGRWPQHKIIFCALFHDLGKAGSPGKPYYIPTKEDWKARKGEFWDVSKDDFMPNAEKSLFTLQQHGIIVDYEESVAIRWNDGPGADGNKPYAFHEPDLALIVHWADFWSSKQEKSIGL